MWTLFLWPAEREVGGRTNKLPSYLVGTTTTWALSATEKKKLDTNWTRFENYLSPKSNFRLSRYKLRTLKQEPGETVDSFVKKIRILVEECRFTSPDEHIIDALIFTSLIFTLTLDTALDIARTEEVTSNQIKEISPGTSTHVDALSCDPPIRPRVPIIRLCGCCGTEHDISERSFCPAYGSKCGACMYSVWTMVDPVSLAHFMLLMLRVQSYWAYQHVQIWTW